MYSVSGNIGKQEFWKILGRNKGEQCLLQYSVRYRYSQSPQLKEAECHLKIYKILQNQKVKEEEDDFGFGSEFGLVLQFYFFLYEKIPTFLGIDGICCSLEI